MGVGKALLIQPGAFGDILLCAPIAKWYNALGYEVHWPVSYKFLDLVGRFYYATPILLDNSIRDADWLRSDVKKIIPFVNEYDRVLNLADRGPHPTSQRIGVENFEQCKYRLADVPIEEKHKLSWTRNLEKEHSLFNLKVEHKEYAVAHLTNSHGDEAPMPECDLPVIKMDKVDGYTILDWYKIIQKSSKIYCVESSFHQFIDGIIHRLPQEKFLLKKGPVSNGTRHTISKFWDLRFIGKDTKVVG